MNVGAAGNEVLKLILVPTARPLQLQLRRVLLVLQEEQLPGRGQARHWQRHRLHRGHLGRGV